jgi:two-component system sensor histidine kinase AlgZ
LNDSLQTTRQYTSSRAYWICQLSGWSLYSALQLCAAVFLIHLPWARATIEVLLLNGVGLTFTHQLRAYIRRHNWNALSLGSLAPRIAVASLVLALPLGLAAPLASISLLQDSGDLIREVAPTIRLYVGPLISLLMHWLNWATLFAIWSVIYFAVLSVRRRRFAELRQSELIRALQQAELRLLKSQLNPHFLFNALNTVRSLISDNPQGAQSAVTRLGNTLRYTLNAGQDEMVPLSTELGIVTDYLELESLRFEDRLSVACNVSDEAAAVHIPAMLLQTVVENAIKHGIAELPRGGLVKIDGAVRDGMLLLDVVNSRPVGASREAGPGTGLRNSAERLRLIFGPQASIQLDLSQPATATARIRIPAKK